MMTGVASDSPRVLVFPPLLYGLALLIGIALHAIAPLGSLPPWRSRVAGLVLLGLGAGLARWGERTMRRAGTNVSPAEPALALVDAGPFRFTRNPLYLGVTLMYVGVALLMPAVWPLVLLVPVLVVMQWGVVLREERYLERKFGDAYRSYRGRVRRWL
jgi:protein-S-isoprenylcysteine O-methyltransferase Ste14